MNITIGELGLPKGGTVVIGVLADKHLTKTGVDLDRRASGALVRAMAASRFTGGRGQWLEVLAPAGLPVNRIVLYGLGKPGELDLLGFEAMAGDAARKLATSGEVELSVIVDPVGAAKIRSVQAAAHAAYGARLGGYRFDKYHTKAKPEDKPSLDKINILVKDAAGARQAYAPLDRTADAIHFARNLVTEPANVIYPESLAAECRKLTRLGVRVEVLGEAAMKKLGMGALLGVGQGSVRESQLVVLHWLGGKKGMAPIAFVGKGVCFDTGGISIKPAAGMEEMKWDMGGAAAVIGAMMALAGRKAKVNAIGVVGLVENMPSGSAQRPGDVVKTMSGQTVEVLNTDAEGRLVLADALWYCQDRFKPKVMVDLATLTGAIITALGHEQAGVFANNDTLAQHLLDAGKAEGEKLWRLPLDPAYDREMDSGIADVQNISGAGVGANSITAAQFLQRFVNNVHWAHLDIAGMAWSKKDRPTVPKGATAYGVRLLDCLARKYYEGR